MSQVSTSLQKYCFSVDKMVSCFFSAYVFTRLTCMNVLFLVSVLSGRDWFCRFIGVLFVPPRICDCN
jgi:hypothetical protein